jgi:recombinational DNA repair ATPase RecF
VLKQRNALLRSAHGRMSADVEATLAVWDAKFVDAGEAWADARADLVGRLAPRVGEAYDHLAGVHHASRWSTRPSGARSVSPLRSTRSATTRSAAA